MRLRLRLRPSLVVLAFVAARGARADDPVSPREPPRPTPASPTGGAQDSDLDAAVLPKAEMRVPEFLAAHPEADGRGVVVAILDTGIDPGHPRLSKTTTGESKLVDFLDATDDGIVDTTTAVAPADVVGGQVVGASGRLLTLGDHWAPGRKAFLGRIDARNVLPPPLVDRLRTRRRERLDEAVKRARDAGTPVSPDRDGEDGPTREARRAAEATARESLPDEAPVYDVLVVERDGSWRVVIDTDADGDLTKERPLRDFSVAQEWVTLRDDAELNVGVRPDADGRHVRVLFDGGGHGTHVAGIVAGFEGPSSGLNGVAPGARILAIKVGNSRFASATTNLAFLRAVEWAGQHGAKVVNLSFGGPSFSSDAGTPDSIAADEAVERYGIVCCFSAGNEGPALSTVGAPATARRALSVGAYASPSLMRVAYALLGPDPGERLFGFSSRGPLPGGDLGVSVVAPGAAWSALPCWQLVCGENWNGTSMAAPQVSGACALLLSAARRDGVPASPARVVAAVKAGARPVEKLLPPEQGAGLVQVDRAYDVLVAAKDEPEPVELRAKVVNPTGVGGGVYERDLGGTPLDRAVSVSVAWRKDATNAARNAYEHILSVVADEPWIEVPPRLELNAGGGNFAVRVDGRSLAEGLHAGVVRVFDAHRKGAAPELVVPVTVVKAASPDATGRWRGEVVLEPGDRTSRFVRVPFGASRAKVRLVARSAGTNRLTLAGSTVDAWRRPDDRTVKQTLTMAPGAEHEESFEVYAGTVVELCLFSHWNRNVPATYEVDLRFLGPAAVDRALAAGPGEDVVLLRLATPLGAFRGKVRARVNEVVERPTVEREVVTSSDAPLLGGGRLYVQRQRFSARIGAGERWRVVPRATRALDEQLEDARWRVVDAAGRVVKKAVVDGPFSLEGLSAGTYTVEFEAPTWGKSTADTGLVGFDLRRARDDAWASVFPTADLAAADRGGDASLDLPAGSVRSFALRLPGLDAGRTYAGSVEVLDEHDDVTVTLPLAVDRTTTAVAPDASEATDALVAALRVSAEASTSAPFAARSTLDAARGSALRALELRPGDRDVELVLLRVEAHLSKVDAVRAEARPRADALVKRFDRGNGGERTSWARALLARARLKLPVVADADADAREARFVLPDGDGDVLAWRVARGLAEGGDRRDALAAARALSERSPADFDAAQKVVELLLSSKWGIPAATEVRTWPERFPSRGADVRATAAKVREAGGDPAPRTLEKLAAGAP